MGMDPKEALAYAVEHNTVMVDFKFTDMLGAWQHISLHINEVDPGTFENGLGFDGSSIRGWQPINKSDMLLMPQAETAVMDPFTKYPTLSVICEIVDPITHEPYSRDPRYVAKKATNYLRSTGIGDSVYIGPEAEFFLFDSVRYSSSQNASFYEIDSDEAHWNSGTDYEGGNKGYKIRAKEGYLPVAPWDTLQDIRTEMVLEMIKVGIHIEASHHEVSTGGQCEIDMRFSDLVSMADQLQWFKYCVRNVAKRNNKSACFMPKPVYGDNGSGMHTHISIWKDGTNLMAGDKYAGMSQVGLWVIGGVLKHARALSAFSNPTVNSYKRLVPGYEAPINLAYSSRNRSASIRIPISGDNPRTRRIEYRTPDPAANGYLSFSALMMAAIDGIENQIDPGQPLDKDIYGLPPEELEKIGKAPESLEEALQALEADKDFLLRGGVFTEDLIEEWTKWKRNEEIKPLQTRPTPGEFDLYYDC
ncbi:MAG: glutamine synthetase [Myxococcota bacterium]|jgi:glutamine synthetase